jgi:phage terminase small subunit
MRSEVITLARHPGITEKNRLMIDEYIANGYNLVQAYFKIYGEKPENMKVSYPYRVFKKPEVQEYLQERRKEIYEAQQIDAERVTSELASIAFAPKGDKDYTANNKVQALNVLSRVLGMQVAKTENKDVIEVSIEDENQNT